MRIGLEKFKNIILVVIISLIIILTGAIFYYLYGNNFFKNDGKGKETEVDNEISETKDTTTSDNQNVNNPNINSEIVSTVRITLCEGFYYEPINDELKAYITGKSYKENEYIDYSDLRCVTVQYVDFNNEVCEGKLIVNVQVADDIMSIFKELFDAKYQIEKIKLIDEYDANDDASMEDNNTSAFNFRLIDGQDTISDHSYGIAIDINPLYNPYVRSGFGDRDVLPVNGTVYADRTKDFEHKIVKGDVCYNAFINRGWKWGGEWNSPIDYQHFYKEIVTVQS